DAPLSAQVGHRAVARVVQQSLHRQRTTMRRKLSFHVSHGVDRMLVGCALMHDHRHSGNRLGDLVGRAGQPNPHSIWNLQWLPLSFGDPRHPKMIAIAHKPDDETDHQKETDTADPKSHQGPDGNARLIFFLLEALLWTRRKRSTRSNWLGRKFGHDPLRG